MSRDLPPAGVIVTRTAAAARQGSRAARRETALAARRPARPGRRRVGVWVSSAP